MKVCSMGSKILMATTFLVIALMPLTEYFWHFDGFLHGGQDFELSLLAILTVLCLVLILFQHGKKDLELLICRRRWLAFEFCHAEPAIPGEFRGLISSPHAEPLPNAALGMYTLPLQV
jgi:hypothetical protein